MFMQLSPKERFGYVALGAIVLTGFGFIVGQKLRRPAAINLQETKQPPVSFDHGPSPYGASSQSKQAEQSGKQLIVHIVGAVARPGIIAVPQGSRVYEAVQAAGGFSGDANTDAVNLAAKVQDGTQIAIPYLDGPGSSTGGMPVNPGHLHSNRSKQPPGIVNINTADTSQLTSLPGIGNSFAERIIEYRTEHGSFRSPDDLLSVQGFGKRRLDQIRQWVSAN